MSATDRQDPTVLSERVLLWVVMPVFDDWESAVRVLEILDESVGGANFTIERVLLVDDGSTTPWREWETRLATLRSIGEVEVLELVGNVGHQRALALGLAHVARHRGKCDIVVTMDADGEDRPEDVFKLAHECVQWPGAVVVARRTGRREGILNRAMYVAYKTLFRLLTGQRLEFGNFIAVPAQHVDRLVAMPQLWNHYSATVLLSRIPLRQQPMLKGRRYAGRSRMNLVSLVVHGLAAISVFADVAFARVLLLSVLSVVLAVIGIAVAIGIRMLTELAIPGWATFAVGLGVIMALQAVMLTLTSAFVLLHSRMAIYSALNSALR